MLGLTALLTIGAFQASVKAQDTSHATCTDPQYAWSFNSLQQSPCTIGEALGNVCTSDGSFNIQYLPAGYYYSGIAATAATTCVCNTVYYSMLSVCAACQGGSVAAWNSWDGNCTDVYSTFPDPIPQGSAVPNYAYLPLLANGTFDFASAINDHGAEATPTGGSTTTHASSGSSSGTSSASTSSSTSAPKKSSHTGAIVGGAVGGVVVLAAVAGLIFFCLRRKRTTQATASQPIEPSFLANNTTGTSYNNTMAASFVPDKVYDPNDPSTFPDAYNQQPQQNYAHPVSSYQMPASPGAMTNGYNMPQQHTGQTNNSGYRGVAEI